MHVKYMHLSLHIHNYVGNSIKGRYEHMKANQKKYGWLHAVKDNKLVDNETRKKRDNVESCSIFVCLN